ncbi:GGDEF domain-containing protein [Uliginosibacterium paludis]|uniref:GGDEF domain-containing protein n=1 Tax=Uliginosibacterium paludis TaxID=1615952 RepID=A0ABV2CUU8_9RHOO
MNRLNSFLIPALCSVLALVLTALGCFQLNAAYERHQIERFNAAAGEVVRALKRQLDEDNGVLDAVSAYRRSSPQGNLAGFLEARLRQHAPAGLHAISLAPLILPEQRETFVASQVQRGLADFAIRPAGERPLYAPVALSQGPGNQPGLPAGLDLLADPGHQEVLTESRDTAEARISGQVRLHTSAGGEIPGFVMVAPVFSSGQVAENANERRTSIEAWVVASFSLETWVAQALKGLPPDLALSLVRSSANGETNAIYPVAESTPAAGQSLLVSEQPLSFGTQTWTARVTALPGFLARDGGNPAKYFGLLGLVLATLLFFITMTLTTSRRRAQLETERLNEALSESEERWRFALEGSGDGVWDWDVRTGKVSFSPRCDGILGMSDGKAAEARIHPEDEAGERSAMQACLEGRSTQYASEHRMQGEDGQWRWIAARGMVTQRTIAGAAARMIGTMSDVTERKTVHDKLQDMPQIDALTGLPNRTLFFDRLQQSLRLVKRQRETLALIHTNIDNYKGLIDNFGQTVSNKLIQEVAYRISESIRDSDTVAHLGRDEFMILLPHLSDEQDVHIVLEKIRSALSTDFVIHNRHIGISLSYGVSLFPQHARTAETLFNAAQRATQQARKAGGNGVAFSLAQ